MMEYFHFRAEMGTLTIAIFVAGYTLGPVFGPLSEQYGRRPVFLFTFLTLTAFQIGCALSKNTASILIFRFLSGTFASAPLTNTGALISDIWGPRERGLALSAFSLAPFAGPSLGPLAGGFIGATGTSWRVLFWAMAGFAGVCTVAIFFTLPETYAPIILVRIAQEQRKTTGDIRWYAWMETQPVHWRTTASNIITKPFRILFSEMILMLITLYLSFVYGCMYLLFEAYPIVYGPKGHGFGIGKQGLMYMPVFGGGVVAVLLAVHYYNPRYERLIKQHEPMPVPPEARLPMAQVGGISFCISFFWFGFTSYRSVSWAISIMSGVASGFGVVLIFALAFQLHRRRISPRRCVCHGCHHDMPQYTWSDISIIRNTDVRRAKPTLCIADFGLHCADFDTYSLLVNSIRLMYPVSRPTVCNHDSITILILETSAFSSVHYYATVAKMWWKFHFYNQT